MNATINDAGKVRKLLLTALVVGGLSALVGLGTYSAFTATTTNSGNNISSGTVKIDQHAGATTLYNVTNQKPGDATAKCLRVTYSGSLTASAVKLYASAGITNGTQYNLQIERGSGLTTLNGTMSCAGFSSTSTAYNGDLGCIRGHLRRRRRRQGLRGDLGHQRHRGLPVHDHPERRHDRECPHLGASERCAYLHLGGTEASPQLSLGSQRGRLRAAPFLACAPTQFWLSMPGQAYYRKHLNFAPGPQLAAPRVPTEHYAVA